MNTVRHDILRRVRLGVQPARRALDTLARQDRGAATAEYAVATMAIVGELEHY